MGHRSFFLLSLLAQALLAFGAATRHGGVWCAASIPAWGLLVLAYGTLRKTPYARILRASLVGTPLAVALTGWVPGWPGIAVRWIAFFVVAAWHHSALQALREWARFDVVIGPRERT